MKANSNREAMSEIVEAKARGDMPLKYISPKGMTMAVFQRQAAETSKPEKLIATNNSVTSSNATQSMEIAAEYSAPANIIL
jgi:hypothetical protein